MGATGGIQTYLEIVRSEFLVFSFVVASVPATLALITETFDPVNTALATLLVLSAQAGVNAINVASDYRRGIDGETEATPFSGGVDTLTSGRASYATARNIGIMAVAVTVALSLWLVRQYDAVEVAALVLPGLVLVVGYTDVFTRIGLGELSCGIGLGAIPTLVVFYAQSGALVDEAVLLAIPMFLVCFNLLLLNEFPDIDADSKNGRTNIPIAIGRRLAGYLYFTVVVATAVSLVVLVSMHDLPVTILLALLPTALIAGILRKFLSGNPDITETDLLYHTLWTLGTPAFISVGLLIRWLTL
jgi:1,4-dihydroxy-2-naphthoate octaprenyltransferase